jgi:hypothetical protein
MFVWYPYAVILFSSFPLSETDIKYALKNLIPLTKILTLFDTDFLCYPCILYSESLYIHSNIVILYLPWLWITHSLTYFNDVLVKNSRNWFVVYSDSEI